MENFRDHARFTLEVDRGKNYAHCQRSFTPKAMRCVAAPHDAARDTASRVNEPIYMDVGHIGMFTPCTSTSSDGR